MVITRTQDEWNTRSIDSTHINPSIMEGERVHTSLFGHDSAVPIERYAPVFLVQPTIGGSFKIPSILTCIPGVIDSSPSPTLYFQWKADGVDIPGATTKTLTTNLSFDENYITCEVVAVNYLGTATGISDGITAQVVEPVINQEYQFYVAQGLHQPWQQNMLTTKWTISSGMSGVNRVDNMGVFGMSSTGLGGPQRNDMVSQTITLATGLPAPARLDSFCGYDYTLTGLEIPQTQALYHNEVYSMWQPTYLYDLAIVNRDASAMNTSGWTITRGDIRAVNTAQYEGYPPGGGWWFTGRFQNGTGGTFSQSEPCAMNQNINLDPAYHADTDAGLMFYDMSALANIGYDNYGLWDEVRMTLKFFDSFGVQIGSPRDLIMETNWGTGFFAMHHNMIGLPPNTRSANIELGFSTIQDQPVRCEVDNLRVRFFRDKR
jgi:hypothetical protein